MTWLRGAAIPVLLVLVLVPMLAGAGASAGLCTISIRFDFAGSINNNSPPTTYTMTGSGTCQTSAGIGKTVFIAGNSGVATSARCATLVMSGDYVVDMFPDPAPQSSNGEFNFVGTASGGIAHMRGSNPTFIGATVLAGGGLLGCAGGTNSLSFSMILAFVDP